MPGVTLTTKAKRAIYDRGFRLYWLAEQMGVSHSHLSRQLDGERAISDEQATRMSELTGLPVDVFRDLDCATAEIT